MLINQHRDLSAINIVLVTVVGCLLCIGVFLHLPPKLTPVLFEPAINNLLYIDLDGQISPELNVLTTLILTIFQAFQLNRVVNYYNFLGKPNFLTALVYMTLVSLFIPFLVLSPTLICNFLTIWMLGKLFKIYKLSDIKGRMFDLGLIVGIGSLVYFPFISMLVLLWVSLMIFRPFNWREWVIPLLGSLTIYFLLAVIYVWLNRFDEYLKIFHPFSYPFPTTLNFDYTDCIVLIPVLIAIVFFVVVLKNQYFKSIVYVRKSFSLLFFMILLIIISFYLNEQSTINHFLLCVPPISIYLAYYFTHASKRWVYESIYALILIGIIAAQFL